MQNCPRPDRGSNTHDGEIQNSRFIADVIFTGTFEKRAFLESDCRFTHSNRPQFDRDMAVQMLNQLKIFDVHISGSMNPRAMRLISKFLIFKDLSLWKISSRCRQPFKRNSKFVTSEFDLWAGRDSPSKLPRPHRRVPLLVVSLFRRTPGTSEWFLAAYLNWRK